MEVAQNRRNRGTSWTSWRRDVGFGGTLFADVDEGFRSLHERPMEEPEKT